ncbi:MAG: hypothetical protein AAF828_09385 [Bacteroidota bacterium]
MDRSTQHIPEGGTLGILAAGYRGIMAWRHVRWTQQQNRITQRVKKVATDEKK